MSIYISPNYVKKKSDYTSTDKVSIYINYYYKGKKLRIPSGVDKRWKQGDKTNPILKSDKDYRIKNLLLKQKTHDINQIIHDITLNNQIPVCELVKNKI